MSSERYGYEPETAAHRVEYTGHRFGASLISNERWGDIGEKSSKRTWSINKGWMTRKLKAVDYSEFVGY